MGTATPRLWRQLLEQLQFAAAEAMAAAVDSDAAGNSWQPSNMQAICETIWSLERLPNKPPKAAWKKVVASQVHRTQGCVSCLTVQQLEGACGTKDSYATA